MVGDQPKSEKYDCYLNQFIVKCMDHYDNIQYQSADYLPLLQLILLDSHWPDHAHEPKSCHWSQQYQPTSD